MKIIVDINFSKEKREALKEKFKEIDFYFIEDNYIPNDFKENAEVMVGFSNSLDSNLLNSLPLLKWYHCLSAGVDSLPINMIYKRDILLSSSKGIHKIPISEYVLSMILNVTLDNYYFLHKQQKREWDYWIDKDEVFGKTVGIIGMGNIGKEIAKYCKNINMKTLGLSNSYNKYVKDIDIVLRKDDLHILLKESDFVILSLPLTKETHHLIGIEEFKAMKQNAYIINISRGDIIDEEALIYSLENNFINGAILDVFHNEPLPPESKLWELKNTIITPHSSSKTNKYLDRAIKLFEENLESYLQNSAVKNLYSFEKGY
ncbi:D-2-hydroxyacid dehydrogenase [Staphylococcus pseudintermedius]|uniref:D-2-hydroxyacid dehydrogenase n=1 Tax=Staphylococcus pseudintermedius TaxID=283734 RepID=UPI002B2579B7|nr:D-2-hydroxyacid dehydrogenase [Staphylococcus pseudintermedius]WQL14961.1 D-2-hydroxyacid dehydrogenase [Staphylococcus pseudintermedius]